MRRKKDGRSEVERETETPRVGRMGGLVILGWANQNSGTGQSEYSIGVHNLTNHRILFRCWVSDQSEHRIEEEY